MTSTVKIDYSNTMEIADWRLPNFIETSKTIRCLLVTITFGNKIFMTFELILCKTTVKILKHFFSKKKHDNVVAFSISSATENFNY